MRLTRLASEKRGGGSVKCWVETMRRRVSAIALAHGRQAAFVLVRLVVLALVVERQEAVELDDLAGGAQVELARADLGEDVGGGAFELGRFHLARDGAGPDQFVEARLLGLEDTSPPAWAGG